MPTHKVNSKWKIVNGIKKSIHHLPLTIHFKVKQGFTLIELLIVIAVIAILAGATVRVYSGSQQKARDSVRKSDLTQIRRSLELAKQDCRGAGYYPVMAGSDEYVRYDNLQIHLSDTDLKYTSSTPDDPKNTDSYRYGYHTDSSTTANVCLNTSTPSTLTQSGSSNFMLRALLEQGNNDPDSQKSFAKCQGKPGIPASAGGYFYVCNE